MGAQAKKWGGQSRGGAWGHRFFVCLVRFLGLRAAYGFLALVAVYFIPFAPRATAAIWRYNRRILHYGRLVSLWRLYVHYYRFGQCLIDKIAIAHGMASRYHFEFEQYDEFLQHLEAGPCLIMGAHVGCWEIGAEFFGDYASKLNVVMFDAEYERIKEVLEQSPKSYQVIAVNEGSLESLLRMKRAVDLGEHLCFQGDRYVDEASSVELSFMGHQALFPIGPALVGAKLNLPIIFYFAMRESGCRYRFMFRMMPASSSPEEIRERYLRELEDVLKRYPQQWFNFFDLWLYD